MIEHSVEASAEVAAGAERVYRIVADYREAHPRIIPKSFFSGIEVEQGGFGAGTVIRVGVHFAGRRSAFRATVTEPDPGRILVETDLDGGPVTTFTFEPLGPGRARVTISTLLRRRGKKLGLVERFLTRRFLRRVYAEELRLLAAVATGGDA
ncbi:MAG TPA: SRPBCC family protein [Longimicrobium sp.]|nr:SRPBCC family protein [Longimicrobium sp.]